MLKKKEGLEARDEKRNEIMRGRKHQSVSPLILLYGKQSRKLYGRALEEAISCFSVTFCLTICIRNDFLSVQLYIYLWEQRTSLLGQLFKMQSFMWNWIDRVSGSYLQFFICLYIHKKMRILSLFRDRKTSQYVSARGSLHPKVFLLQYGDTGHQLILFFSKGLHDKCIAK